MPPPPFICRICRSVFRVPLRSGMAVATRRHDRARMNSTPQTRDPVIVVGASAAGLFAAHQLAQERVPVCVYERGDQLSSLARTLIVTPEIERVLGFSA